MLARLALLLTILEHSEKLGSGIFNLQEIPYLPAQECANGFDVNLPWLHKWKVTPSFALC